MDIYFNLKPPSKLFIANTLVDICKDDFHLPPNKLANYDFYMPTFHHRTKLISHQEYLGSWSVQIFKVHFRLVVTLAKDYPIILAPIILAYLYQDLRVITSRHWRCGGLSRCSRFGYRAIFLDSSHVTNVADTIPFNHQYAQPIDPLLSFLEYFKFFYKGSSHRGTNL